MHAPTPVGPSLVTETHEAAWTTVEDSGLVQCSIADFAEVVSFVGAAIEELETSLLLGTHAVCPN